MITTSNTLVGTDQLVDLLSDYPTLTYDGFGVCARRRHRRTYEDRFGYARVILTHTHSRRNIARLMQWIDQWLYPRRTINHQANSYYLKHLAERGISTYCSNGEFICAALLAGYAHQPIGELGLNAVFNMSSVAITAIEAAQKQANFRTATTE